MSVKPRLTIDAYLREQKVFIDKYIDDVAFDSDNLLKEACNYALCSGGKRIRPILSLITCDTLGVGYDAVLPFATAIEYLHTYSLIHDDMPCMDNDDLRRGKPTVHVEYGEDMALLAGDTLLTHAFVFMLQEDRPYTLRCMKLIVDAVGIDGMIGGQLIDLLTVKDEDGLIIMDTKKTGALLRASIEVPCVIHGVDDDTTEKLSTYGHYLGLAFQVRDDLLNVVGSEQTLGKHTGTDVENGKSTYVTMLGVDGATDRLGEYIAEAKKAIVDIPDNARFIELADYLCDRVK